MNLGFVQQPHFSLNNRSNVLYLPHETRKEEVRIMIDEIKHLRFSQIELYIEAINPTGGGRNES